MNKIRYLMCLFILGMSQICYAQTSDQPKDIAQNVYSQMPKGFSKGDIDQLVDQHFDTKLMGQQSLGINWRGLQEEQKQAYLTAFDKFFKKNLLNVLNNYKNVQIKDLVQRVNGNTANVSAIILPSNQQPVAIDLPLEQSGGTWKAYDVNIEHISLIQGYKAQFIDAFKKGGIQSVIDNLNSKA